MPAPILIILFGHKIGVNAMKMMYHIPNLGSTQADIFIYNNYRDAFLDLGHEFVPLENSQPFAETLAREKPDVLVTNTHDLYWKHIDLAALGRARKEGLFALAFAEPMRGYDDYGLSSHPGKIELIRAGKFADAYFSYAEAEGTREFCEAAGYPCHCVPLAANKKLHFPQNLPRNIDIAFVGNRLPRKARVFDNILFPMRSRYRIEVYGSNWSPLDLWLNRIGRAGRRFNLPLLRDVKGTRWISLEGERALYSSAKVCPNFHEDEQAKLGVDCNERTFKVPACGGFEISDNARAVRHYYAKDEVATLDAPEELPGLVDYFASHEEERTKMQKKATARTLREHTYHNRARQILEIVKKTQGNKSA